MRIPSCSMNSSAFSSAEWVYASVQGRLLLNLVFIVCIKRVSCLVFPLLPLINLPYHLETWHDMLKSTTGLHQSWHTRNQMAELWKMEPVITACLGVWDAAECQSERPLLLYQRHSSPKILRVNARLNYWLKCKYFALRAQYIPIMNELWVTELDLERMECSKQLYLKPGLVETTTVNHWCFFFFCFPLQHL